MLKGVVKQARHTGHNYLSYCSIVSLLSPLNVVKLKLYQYQAYEMRVFIYTGQYFPQIGNHIVNNAIVLNNRAP